jgi:hypothetical protein
LAWIEQAELSERLYSHWATIQQFENAFPKSVRTMFGPHVHVVRLWPGEESKCRWMLWAPIFWHISTALPTRPDAFIPKPSHAKTAETQLIPHSLLLIKIVMEFLCSYVLLSK